MKEDPSPESIEALRAEYYMSLESERNTISFGLYSSHVTLFGRSTIRDVLARHWFSLS